MKTPENIYILPDDRNPNDLSICWYEAPYSTGAIEYTRTDTFMEKAKSWFIQQHIGMWNSFKNYIKGE